MSSESSSDESDLPSLSVLKSSRQVQRKVDERLAEIQNESRVQGNNTTKIKSKRGGSVDMVVCKRVAWPQDSILAGATKQQVSYDQLTLVQFVQGFTRNILDERNAETRERMLWYLNELMEDVSDFSWGSAKAAHAVLLCEMERGTVDWHDTHRIDRIRRAHAQKHTGKQNWGRNFESKKPWFCKAYQQGQCTFARDHESGGKMQKHICSFCLMQGRTLAHPEKDCVHARKNQSKNEQVAAQGK